jgi:hypothetical protein
MEIKDKISSTGNSALNSAKDFSDKVLEKGKEIYVLKIYKFTYIILYYYIIRLN